VPVVIDTATAQELSAARAYLVLAGQEPVDRHHLDEQVVGGPGPAILQVGRDVLGNRKALHEVAFAGPLASTAR
jgi:hypothetical protein